MYASLSSNKRLSVASSYHFKVGIGLGGGEYAKVQLKTSLRTFPNFQNLLAILCFVVNLRRPPYPQGKSAITRNTKYGRSRRSGPANFIPVFLMLYEFLSPQNISDFDMAFIPTCENYL